MSHILEVARRRFQLILIKPSHYDDDGYVIRWWRAMIPSNSLAALYGIAAECAERKVLGDDTAIDITVIDETNTRIDVAGLLAQFKRHDNFGMISLVGVQTNQYPRALDIARPFRDAGLPVTIGGFHVSGCLSMLDGKAVGLDACRDMGISMFAGEAEGRLDMVLRDAAAGELKPLYNFMNDLPGIGGTPVPFLPKDNIQRTLGLSTSFDAGRGCPYQCSFCTIINVQGRKSRFRSADDVEKLVRMNWAQGIHKFFITDDNFARNKDWEAIFDRLIELKERDGIPLGLMIQVDTLCHKIPNFIEKSRRAGVTRVFIGLENVNPDNLTAAKKNQNKITEYRKMLLAWKAQGIMTLAGYILGFPADTPESIRRDIAIIQEELPLDVIEFFILTPLPGSEDHQVLWKKGVDMDADLNIYDVEHVCTAHPKMSKQEWEDIYHEAWALYYSPDHMKTLLRRAVATGVPLARLVKVLVSFATTVPLENVHPLQSGLLRLKTPSERRPDLPRENPLVFWPRFAWETFRKHVSLAGTIIGLTISAFLISRNAKSKTYMDQALTPVADDEEETLHLFTQTAGGAAAVSHVRKVAQLTAH
ncbi:MULTISPECIES: B12-binding domain-containing radical SAM protein [Rhizobium]|uniref:Radical SAM domain protein n=1 Tax=Rhizobium leguminosarum bv. trifolii (strain WSM1325) TaxID=395491 RepID=C6AWF4_RHILS|nr:radical SAM protein [Rhizobium leguminosarum]ACS55992.1 Radical SAM domain protein [Rhizobium leguminosarum bv. trifolii WSM1325]MBY2908119.1 radical SAM protein [Rhizobium leguminosarum]MBY2935497.1 radical SAM protein [Rhizobium leguminosarum]MBY2941360.1 radical SAM protein [Rhizobium leguminosarum]MBY2947893.1 radical SAM protein [Rhizobium leguminosarum]